MKNFILGTIAGLAFLFLLGLAGSLEHDTITIGQFVMGGTVSIIAAWLALKHMDM